MTGRLGAVLLALATLGSSHLSSDAVVARTYHANGSLATERRYVDGREQGRHRGWWPNGQARFDYRYADGVLTGEAIEWFANGRPYREAHYAAGHEAGSQRMWFADGTLRASYVVRDGRRYGLMGAKGCVTAAH